jgi:hypothetical protein
VLLTHDDTTRPGCGWRTEKRESVVREIVTTERNYIRVLQAVLDLYQGPLEAKARAKKKWITEDQVKSIFYQIKGKHHCHSHTRL